MTDQCVLLLYFLHTTTLIKFTLALAAWFFEDTGNLEWVLYPYNDSNSNLNCNYCWEKLSSSSFQIKFKRNISSEFYTIPSLLNTLVLKTTFSSVQLRSKKDWNCCNYWRQPLRGQFLRNKSFVKLSSLLSIGTL